MSFVYLSLVSCAEVMSLGLILVIMSLTVPPSVLGAESEFGPVSRIGPNLLFTVYIITYFGPVSSLLSSNFGPVCCLQTLVSLVGPVCCLQSIVNVAKILAMICWLKFSCQDL